MEDSNSKLIKRVTFHLIKLQKKFKRQLKQPNKKEILFLKKIIRSSSQNLRTKGVGLLIFLALNGTLLSLGENGLLITEGDKIWLDTSEEEAELKMCDLEDLKDKKFKLTFCYRLGVSEGGTEDKITTEMAMRIFEGERYEELDPKLFRFRFEVNKPGHSSSTESDSSECSMIEFCSKKPQNEKQGKNQFFDFSEGGRKNIFQRFKTKYLMKRNKNNFLLENDNVLDIHTEKFSPPERKKRIVFEANGRSLDRAKTKLSLFSKYKKIPNISNRKKSLKKIKLSKFEDDLRKGVFAFSRSLDKYMNSGRKLRKCNSLMKKKLPSIISTNSSTPKIKRIQRFLHKKKKSKSTKTKKLKKQNSHHFSNVRIKMHSGRRYRRSLGKKRLKQFMMVKSGNLVAGVKSRMNMD